MRLPGAKLEPAVEAVQEAASQPEALSFAFAPIHKAALGVAVGLVLGSLIAAVTVFHLILRPTAGPNIGLLAQYFYGYEVTWFGAILGFLWGG